MKRILTAAAVMATLASLAFVGAGCGSSQADVAASNISKAAEQFQVERRIVFINGITDKYLFVIQGACSVETSDSALGGSLQVTCKIGPKQFCKSYLGLSDNVTYIVQQIGSINVGTSHYRVIFRPTTIIPNFDNTPGGGSGGVNVTGSCST